MTLIIGILLGAATALLPQLFPFKGETNILGVLITCCKHSKRWRWLAWQIYCNDWENEYLDIIWERMKAHDAKQLSESLTQ